MSGRVKKLSLLFVIVLMTIPYLSAQENDTPIDTTFNEIVLTERYVTAVDTLGNDWYYDFESDQFVLGDQPEAADLRRDEDFNQDELSVEERCINKKKVKKWAKSVTVGIDEYVDNDIFVTGRVTIKGWVKGDVTSTNNRVLVASTGQVDGDINAGTIILHDGAVVKGLLDESTPLDLPDIPTGVSEAGVIAIISTMAFLFISIFMITALTPKKMQVFSDCFINYKTRSSFLGLLVLLLMPVIFILLIITIVGIVLIPLVPILYLIAGIMGLASFSNILGRFICKKSFGSEKGLYFQTFIGFSIYAIIWILGITLMTGNEESVLFGFGIFLFVCSILLSIIPFFGGIGAAVLTRFGFRPYQSWKDRHAGESPTPAPAPPPIPDIPNIKSPPPPSGPYRSDNH